MEDTVKRVRSFVANAADQAQVKAGARKEREQRREELDDLKTLMALPSGRRFLWRLINTLCHCDATSAVQSGSMTYLLEGERNVGRVVKGDIFEAALEAWQGLEREYVAAQRRPEDEEPEKK